MAEPFNPKGKTFTQRLDAFIADAKTTYSVSLRRDAGRSAEWQQKHHVAHMFVYNAYQSTKPAHTEVGKRTISWDHVSDPKVVWATVKCEDLLRTKKNLPPSKESTGWKKDFAPDREATETYVKTLLKSANIGGGGTAMVSAGLKPCGEPCRCGAERSKHLDNLAADLNSSDLTQLTNKLKEKKGPELDAYLKQFGLHRPLLNHSTSPESWHVEALDDAKL